MIGEIWKEPGKTGRVFVVYPQKVKEEDAIKETAAEKHIKKSDLKAVTGWTHKGELYICKDAPAKKGSKENGCYQKGVRIWDFLY